MIYVSLKKATRPPTRPRVVAQSAPLATPKLWARSRSACMGARLIAGDTRKTEHIHSKSYSKTYCRYRTSRSCLFLARILLSGTCCSSPMEFWRETTTPASAALSREAPQSRFPRFQLSILMVLEPNACRLQASGTNSALKPPLLRTFSTSSCANLAFSSERFGPVL